MKRMALLCLAVILLSGKTTVAQVDVEKKGKLSGLFYADYYWIAQNHDSDLEGNDGFWFRRIYLTYDHEITDSFSGRLRLEMKSEGDFLTESSLQPELKDAWLRWSTEDHSITAGISPTPTFGLVEDIWGYRSVEKAPQDLYDFGSSRDFGVALQGNLDGADKLTYHFMVGNGNGIKTELNKGKKYMLAFGYYFNEHVVLQGYGDWNDSTGNQNRYTVQGLLGYLSEMFNVGILYSRQFRKNATARGVDLNLDLVSLFTNMTISDDLKAFARIDHLFDKNPTGPENSYLPISDRAESTFLTGGLDIVLDKNIYLIPNIEAIIYGSSDTGTSPESDLIPRLTLFYSF